MFRQKPTFVPALARIGELEAHSSTNTAPTAGGIISRPRGFDSRIIISNIFKNTTESIEAAQHYIEKGANINVVNEDGMTPLAAAIRTNNPALAKWLIEKGASISKAIDHALPDYNLVAEAIRRGETWYDTATTMLEICMNKEIHLYARSVRGERTSLSTLIGSTHNRGLITCYKGFCDRTRETLSSRGPDDTMSTIHVAATTGDFTLMRELLRLEPESVAVEDEHERTALFHSMQPPHTKNKVKCAHQILAKIQNVSDLIFMNSDGTFTTALHQATKSGNPELLKATISTYARLSIVLDTVKNHLGETALHTASKEGTFVPIQVLLNAGMDPNTPDEAGIRPLHHSARRGHSIATEKLLTSGARLSVLDEDGHTPMHFAANEAVMNRMFAVSPDAIHIAGLENRSGQTPVEYMQARGTPARAVGRLEQLIAGGSPRTAADVLPMEPEHPLVPRQLFQDTVTRASGDSPSALGPHR